LIYSTCCVQESGCSPAINNSNEIDVLDTTDDEDEEEESESESESEFVTVDECVKCVCQDECELGFMIQVFLFGTTLS